MPTEKSMAFGGSPTSLGPPKKANDIDEPEILLDTSNLSKHKNLKTKPSQCRTERSARPRMAGKSALRRASDRLTGRFCNPNRVRKSPFSQYTSKISNSVSSASFRHKALSKALNLGPITCQGALRMAGELHKAELDILKDHFKASSDLFSDAEALLNGIAAAHPKYDHMIRAIPALANLVPGEFKEKLLNGKNVHLLKIGVFLANKWISRSA